MDGVLLEFTGCGCVGQKMEKIQTESWEEAPDRVFYLL